MVTTGAIAAAIAVFTGIGAGVGIGITKCVDCVRNYRKRLAKDAEIAKKELVEGINSYDAMYSEQEEE